MFFLDLLKPSSYSKAAYTAFVSMCANALQTVIKYSWAGYVGSYALYADAAHGAQDILMNFLMVCVAVYAARPADRRYPYGRGRYESLAVLLMTVLVFSAAWELMLDAVTTPMHSLAKSPSTILISLGSLGLNLGLAYWMYRISLVAHSDLIYAHALHHLGDAGASCAVAVAYIAACFGYVWADRVACLGIVFLMIYSILPAFRDAVREVTDHATDEAYLDILRAQVLKVPEILDVHDVRSRRSAGRVIVDAHITLRHCLSFTESHWIAECLTQRLQEEDARVQGVLLHVDPDVLTRCSMPTRSACVERWVALGVPEEALRPEQLVIHYIDDSLILDWYPKGAIKIYTEWASLIKSHDSSVKKVRIWSLEACVD